jgi:hypothetical protein
MFPVDIYCNETGHFVLDKCPWGNLDIFQLCSDLDQSMCQQRNFLWDSREEMTYKLHAYSGMNIFVKDVKAYNFYD